MNTCTSSNTAPMPPTSDPLKLFMEDIEKSQTLTLDEKYVKIHMHLVSLKEEMCKIKDLGLPYSKQFLDYAIKTLEVEHDSASEKLKNITNETEVTYVGVLPNLNPTNTVLQAPQISMQSQQGTWYNRLWQRGPLQTVMQQQRYQRLQLGQARQQQLQQGLLQPQVMKPSQLQQQMIQQQQIRQSQMQQLPQPQIINLNPIINETSQLQQHRELLQQLGQQVFGQQG